MSFFSLFAASNDLDARAKSAINDLTVELNGILSQFPKNLGHFLLFAIPWCILVGSSIFALMFLVKNEVAKVLGPQLPIFIFLTYGSIFAFEHFFKIRRAKRLSAAIRLWNENVRPILVDLMTTKIFNVL